MWAQIYHCTRIPPCLGSSEQFDVVFSQTDNIICCRREERLVYHCQERCLPPSRCSAYSNAVGQTLALRCCIKAYSTVVLYLILQHRYGDFPFQYVSIVSRIENWENNEKSTSSWSSKNKVHINIAIVSFCNHRCSFHNHVSSLFCFSYTVLLFRFRKKGQVTSSHWIKLTQFSDYTEKLTCFAFYLNSFSFLRNSACWTKLNQLWV